MKLGLMILLPRSLWKEEASRREFLQAPSTHFPTSLNWCNGYIFMERLSRLLHEAHSFSLCSRDHILTYYGHHFNTALSHSLITIFSSLQHRSLQYLNLLLLLCLKTKKKSSLCPTSLSSLYPMFLFLHSKSPQKSLLTHCFQFPFSHLILNRCSLPNPPSDLTHTH